MPRPTPEPSPASIRAEYERHGAREYYEQFGPAYRNPHEPIIVRALQLAVDGWRPDLTDVLDIAAGSGEATLALRELGAARITGVDPFTADAYAARTGQPAERLTFADVVGGAMADRRFSLIVCSFALHLCEISRLPAFLYQLAQMSDSLLIVTPHKRPEIRREWGWERVGEIVIDRVRVRLYRKG